MGLINYVQRSVAPRPGRTAACVVGVGMIASGPFVAGATIGVTLIVGGTALFTGGALATTIKRMRASKEGLDVEMRDDLDPGLFHRQIEEMRETDPSPEDTDLPGDDDAWNGARYRVAEQAIAGLLSELGSPLKRCEARLFIYDAERDRLVPSYRPPTAPMPAMDFRVGQGVTGQAFERSSYVYAVGDATHNETYDLTPEMQRRFTGIKAVAATPVFDRDGRPIAVVSVSSTSETAGMLSDDGYQEQIALAEKVAVVLIDVLRLDIPNR